MKSIDLMWIQWIHMSEIRGFQNLNPWIPESESAHFIRIHGFH